MRQKLRPTNSNGSTSPLLGAGDGLGNGDGQLIGRDGSRRARSPPTTDREAFGKISKKCGDVVFGCGEPSADCRTREASGGSQMTGRRVASCPMTPAGGKSTTHLEAAQNFATSVASKRMFAIRHRWRLGGQLELRFKDRFHVLISLPLIALFLVISLGYVLLAVILACILAIMTKGDVERCLGGFASHWYDLYFFTVEAMFTIGFGEPRSPSCMAANLFVSIAVIATSLYNGITLGVLFAKFSCASNRKWAVAFSSQLCGVSVHHLDVRDPPSSPLGPTGSVPTRSSTPDAIDPRQTFPATAPSHIKPGKQWVASESVPLTARSPRNTQRAIRNALPTPEISHLATLKKQYRNTYSSAMLKSQLLSNGGWDLFNRPDVRKSTLDGSSMMFGDGTLRPERIPSEASESTAFCHADRGGERSPVLPTAPTSMAESAVDEAALRDPMNERLSEGFFLSFRFMNLTNSAFFDPRLSIFLLCHEPNDLTISSFGSFHTDAPLEFLEMPITVTVDSRDTNSPLSNLTLQDLQSKSSFYEILVFLTFVDNQSSRTIELRKSWSLSEVAWGFAFKNIIERDFKRPLGCYTVEVDALDEKVDIKADSNQQFLSADKDAGPAGAPVGGIRIDASKQDQVGMTVVKISVGEVGTTPKQARQERMSEDDRES